MVIKLEFFILLGCHSTLRFLRGARRVRKDHDQLGQVIHVERISLSLPYIKLLVDIIGFSFELSVIHDFLNSNYSFTVDIRLTNVRCPNNMRLINFLTFVNRIMPIFT